MCREPAARGPQRHQTDGQSGTAGRGGGAGKPVISRAPSGAALTAGPPTHMITLSTPSCGKDRHLDLRGVPRLLPKSCQTSPLAPGSPSRLQSCPARDSDRDQRHRQGAMRPGQASQCPWFAVSLSRLPGPSGTAQGLPLHLPAYG